LGLGLMICILMGTDPFWSKTYVQAAVEQSKLQHPAAYFRHGLFSARKVLVKMACSKLDESRRPPPKELLVEMGIHPHPGPRIHVASCQCVTCTRCRCRGCREQVLGVELEQDVAAVELPKLVDDDSDDDDQMVQECSLAMALVGDGINKYVENTGKKRRIEYFNIGNDKGNFEKEGNVSAKNGIEAKKGKASPAPPPQPPENMNDSAKVFENKFVTEKVFFFENFARTIFPSGSGLNDKNAFNKYDKNAFNKCTKPTADKFGFDDPEGVSYGDEDGDWYLDEGVEGSGMSNAMDFCAAPKFEGTKLGMVFKKGVRGLGYYRDNGLVVEVSLQD
jgi:hypothetical protein